MRKLEIVSEENNAGLSASEAIVTLDAGGKLLFASGPIEELFGCEPGGLVGRDLVDFIPKHLQRRYLKHIARLQNGASTVRRFSLNVQNNNGRQFEIDISMVRYELKERVVFVAIVHRIAAQEPQEIFQQKAEDYRDLFRLATDPILIIEPGDETVVDVNDRACEAYGLSREEFLGRSLKELTEDVAKGEQIISELLVTGACRAHESVHFRSDGSSIVFLINASLVAYQGRPAILTNNRDISDLKRVRDQLQSNLSLLSSTFEATADGILAVDLENNIVASNEKFLKVWNVPKKLHDLSESSAQITAHVLAMAKSSDRFKELMDRSVEFPDEVSTDELELINGRVLERYTQPQKLDGRTVGRVMSFRDVTKQRRVEETLRESEARYRLLFDRNPYPIWVFDLETNNILAVNDAASQKYGFTRQEFLARTIDDLICDGPTYAAVPDTPESGRLHKKHLTKDGMVLEVEIASQAITFGGRPARLELITDTTERRRAAIALTESEARLRTLLNSMSEGLLQVDKHERIVYMNDRICEMTGFSQEELLDTDWSRLLIDEGPDFVNAINARRKRGLADRYEIRIRKKSGEIIWVIVGGAPVFDSDGNLTGSMGVFTDITDRKKSEERLRHDAMHDGLTGLANRSLFMEHLRVMLKRGRNRKSVPFAVLYLDFDRFKVINDSLGHAEGDKLLKFIARRLESCVRPGDLIARLGGDEFVILLSEITDTAEALLVAERIQNDLKSAFDLGGREIYITTSIGITLSTSGYQSADDMLRDADIAMYNAKSKGKAQYQIFDQAMHKHASRKLQIETEMRGAILRHEFKVFYQPILRLDTGSLVGFEALLRWMHPKRGSMSPEEFIPLAEENGLIMKLGEMVIEHSCLQLREWHEKVSGAEKLTVSVNLSSKEFVQQDLTERIAAHLRDARLDPNFLKLEITESHIMENSELAETIMHRLREQGIEMSLDDFGTGYSSLSYLHRLPVSTLKIDRSFIGRMTMRDENREIVNTIVRLAQNLKMKVVAEGIENMEQLTDLTEMGCDLGQGYLFSEPLDPESARQYIEEHASSTAIDLAVPTSDPVELVM